MAPNGSRCGRQIISASIIDQEIQSIPIAVSPPTPQLALHDPLLSKLTTPASSCCEVSGRMELHPRKRRREKTPLQPREPRPSSRSWSRKEILDKGGASTVEYPRQSLTMRYGARLVASSLRPFSSPSPTDGFLIFLTPTHFG